MAKYLYIIKYTNRFNLILLSLILFGFKSPLKLYKLNTESAYCTHGIYNPLNNNIIYVGIKTDEDNSIIESNIYVRDLKTGNELLIENNTLIPPVGWIDSSKALICILNKDTIKILNQKRHRYTLYSFNIHTKKKEIIKLPLFDSISNAEDEIAVSNNLFIYKTGYAYKKNIRYFKYDLEKNYLSEIEQFRGLDISEFTYDRNKNLLLFNIYNELNHRLCYLMNNEIGVIEAIEKNEKRAFQYLTIDHYTNKVYYIIRDLEDFKIKQTLKYYDIEKKEIKILCTYKEETEFNYLSSYKKNSLIVSLVMEADNHSEYTFNLNNFIITLGFNPNMHLYIMEFDK